MPSRKNSHPIIFIDRDGVINRDPIGDYIKEWKNFVFLPGVLKALKKLTLSKYKIIIISNQAGIGDGVFSKRALDGITKKMLTQMKRNGIKISGIYYCLHGKYAGCKCRKPEIGLFLRAARKFKISKPHTFFIGDKVTDMLAGKRFGIQTAFVLTGHGKYDRKLLTRVTKPDLMTRDLLSAVKKIIKLQSKNR